MSVNAEQRKLAAIMFTDMAGVTAPVISIRTATIEREIL